MKATMLAVGGRWRPISRGEKAETAETPEAAETGAMPWAVVTVWVLLAIGSLIALTVWGQSSSSESTSLFALDVAVGVASWALLPILLRWPVPTAVALGVLAAVSPAATPAATFAVLYVAQRRRFELAAMVAGVGITAHAIRGLWRPIHGLPYGWWFVLVVVAYAALTGWGALTQARQALLYSLRERARRAEADHARQVCEARALERTRIAREMHDVLGHRLSLLATYAGAMEYRPDASPEQLSRAAGVIRSGAHQALDELRQVITVLRADQSDDGDGPQRPQPGLADLPRLVEESSDAGTCVKLSDRIRSPDALPEAAGRTVYRVVQEGLTNARKHAAGQVVRVTLEGAPGGRLAIDVTNPTLPRGADLPSTPGSGTGLIGLAERVELAGGRLDHQLSSGQFQLHAWLPWPA